MCEETEEVVAIYQNQGCALHIACRRAGVNPSTYVRWMVDRYGDQYPGGTAG